jgi:hypothetical protein
LFVCVVYLFVDVQAMRYLEMDGANEEAKSLHAQCLLNRAQSHLNIGDYAASQADCSQVCECACEQWNIFHSVFFAVVATHLFLFYLLDFVPTVGPGISD